VTKPLVIARDNASIHRAWAIPPALKLLEKKAIRLKFLPPYSPELNRIETLWRLIKHRWMALTWRTKKEMEQAVDLVLANFGDQFKMEFWGGKYVRSDLTGPRTTEVRWHLRRCPSQDPSPSRVWAWPVWSLQRAASKSKSDHASASSATERVAWPPFFAF
jgi:hypothetical protein